MENYLKGSVTKNIHFGRNARVMMVLKTITPKSGKKNHPKKNFKKLLVKIRKEKNYKTKKIIRKESKYKRW